MALDVLIIDDDYTDLLMIQRILRDYPTPVQIKVAENGEKGLEAARAKNYNIAILDYKLPDIDGLEVLSRMKADNITYPVIFLTGYGNAQIVELALERGADYYLNKDLEEMIRLPEIIDQCIARHQEQTSK